MAGAQHAPLRRPAVRGATQQGTIADCFILASLIAILSKPNGATAITNMMKEDGTRRDCPTLFGPWRGALLSRPERRDPVREKEGYESKLLLGRCARSVSVRLSDEGCEQ
jgi:hypothetical protein